MALHSTSCLSTVMTCTQPGHANTPGQIKKKEASCQAIHHVSEVMEGGLSHRLLLRLINESAVCSTCRPTSSHFLERQSSNSFYLLLPAVKTKESSKPAGSFCFVLIRWTSSCCICTWVTKLHPYIFFLLCVLWVGGLEGLPNIKPHQ